MQRFLIFMCGFAEMMGIGAVISLHLPWVVSAMVLTVPVMLLGLVLVQPARLQAARERRPQVFVYVPPEQRMYSGQVTRPYVEEEAENDIQWYEEEW